MYPLSIYKFHALVLCSEKSLFSIDSAQGCKEVLSKENSMRAASNNCSSTETEHKLIDEAARILLK